MDFSIPDRTKVILEMAQEFIDPLWEKFPHVTETVKGDMLYMFGEIGARQSLPYLESVLSRPLHPDVLEAAEEAIEKIKTS